MPNLFYLTGWLTSSSQTVILGVLPIATFITNVRLHVTVAFDSSGTDTITVGYTGTTNAYSTGIDVSSTGVKTLTLGSGIGYQTVSRVATAYYVPGVADTAHGKALVILEYTLVPLSP